MRSLAEHEGIVTAIVSGQRDYCVTLRSSRREIEYSCDCPIGLDGEFGKHLAAVGLAWVQKARLERSENARNRK